VHPRVLCGLCCLPTLNQSFLRCQVSRNRRTVDGDRRSLGLSYVVVLLFPRPDTYNFTLRSLSEFVITDTELKLIAAAAKIGLSSNPKNGYRTPAAIGTPIEL